MKIKGKVTHVIFHNDSNGYTIFNIDDGNDELTCTGETYELEIGNEVEVEGEYIEHKVYGTQFKISSYSKVIPKDNSTLISYIADNVKGIGKKKASLIVDTFKDNTINVISNESYKLRELKGLKEDLIDNLVTFFKEDFEKWNSIKFLSSFGISVSVASKIYEQLRSDTITIIKEDPYSLLEFVHNLSFKDIDNIGLKQGIALENESRVSSGIIYSLNQIIEYGHTCCKKENLINYASTFLKVGIKEIEDNIISLKFKEKIHIEKIDDIEYVFLYPFYIAEYNISTYMINSMKKRRGHKEYKKELEAIYENNLIDLSDEQVEAIKMGINNNISIITGGPGTGKTTIIKCIIDILKMNNKSYVLAAPTGRAAKRITETTKCEAKTLHRLLEINKINDKDLESFIYYTVKDIDKDYIIVDESSMIDTLMMNNLVKSLSAKTKLILVGDINQLPSVGSGNVLKDIIHSNIVPYISLEKIYRQSAESDIVLNAHKVNKGEYMEFNKKDTDLYYIETGSIEESLSELKSLMSHRLENYADMDILKDVQILTPTKKTDLGTYNLNKEIGNILNKNESHSKFKNFKLNDKVMQIINNYDKEYRKENEDGKGVYNGDVGYITEVSDDHLIVTFEDERKVKYDKQDVDELILSYAITVHKSQGSEYPYVILPLFNKIPKLFTRNLLYTAMTRAKKMLIIIGRKECLNYMVDNNVEQERSTGLKHHLIKNNK